MKIKGLSIITVFSIFIVLWINFLAFKFETLFQLDSRKIENLIENLCMSYLAGFIFYYLNNYLVEKREKKHIMPFIASNVMRLISNNHTIIHNVSGVMKFDFNWWLDEQDFQKYLSNLKCHDKVKYYFTKEDWIYFLNKRNEATIETIDKLLLTGKYLDEELRTILLAIRSSYFLQEDSNLFSGNNLGKHYKTWFRYFEKIRKLKPYFDNNLKEYYKWDEYIG